MKILVCGGRDYGDYDFLKRTLSSLNPAEIVHGAAKGADSLAGRYAFEHNIPVKVYPADWKRHGQKAGFKRNEQMLADSKPDLVVAFPGGKGTAHMVKYSQSQGYSVLQPTS